MADFDTSDRASRFDRADFSARQVAPQQRLAQERLQAPEPASAPKDPSEHDSTESSRSSPEEADASQNPTGDEQLTAEYLRSTGWSQAEIETILSGPGHPDAPDPDDAASQAQIVAHLRSLGWTNSDIARLLVGPEKSHLTAEAVFRQHAANPAGDQQALVKAMAQSGAKKVQPKPALLAGLDKAHLSPDTPTDVEQIIARFADLPDVQKQRFLMLLASQKQKTADPAGGADKKQGAGSDVLPIVKGGLDLLSTALKKLLDSTKGGTKKNDKGGTGGSKTQFDKHQDDTDPSDGGDEGDSSDQNDDTDPGDEGNSSDQSGETGEDPTSTSEEWDPSSLTDESETIDFDSMTGID